MEGSRGAANGGAGPQSCALQKNNAAPPNRQHGHEAYTVSGFRGIEVERSGSEPGGEREKPDGPAVQAGGGPKISTALRPPKAKEFDMA
jgi:hypothetical protein